MTTKMKMRKTKMGRRIKRKVIWWSRHLVFQGKRLFGPLPKLHLEFGDQNATQFIKARIRDCDLYVEYGCGASTIFAAENGIRTYCVESDSFFAKKISRMIADSKNVTISVRGIGWIQEWSRPIGSMSKKRSRQFKTYSEFPKERIGVEEQVFVLIDGRFRIACALKAAIALESHENYTIVVDDCKGREYFPILEPFFENSQCIGRLGVFEKAKPKSPELFACLHAFELNYE